MPGAMAPGDTYIASVHALNSCSLIFVTYHLNIMSSISSTSTLPSWDPMELFTLVNPDKLGITCVGYAPSKRRRCQNAIAYRNIRAAKAVMSRLMRPGVDGDDMKEMLYNLAEYTLCRGNHQSQATEVSDRWFELVHRERGEEDDWGSDTSDDEDNGDESDDGGSSTSSSSDDEDGDDIDDDDATPSRTKNSAQELRRRFDELEALQGEFEQLLQTQRQTLRDRIPALSLTAQPQQPQANAPLSNHSLRQLRDEQEALRNAEQTRQEEAYLTALSNNLAARSGCQRKACIRSIRRLAGESPGWQRKKALTSSSEQERNEPLFVGQIWLLRMSSLLAFASLPVMLMVLQAAS